MSDISINNKNNIVNQNNLKQINVLPPNIKGKAEGRVIIKFKSINLYDKLYIKNILKNNKIKNKKIEI